jgi:hypothetical protein
MIASKPWYLSKTVWASLITIASATGALFGMPTSAINAGAAADQLLQTITAVSGLVALYGRLTAKERIG